jgi:hypothetical protein
MYGSGYRVLIFTALFLVLAGCTEKQEYYPDDIKREISITAQVHGGDATTTLSLTSSESEAIRTVRSDDDGSDPTLIGGGECCFTQSVEAELISGWAPKEVSTLVTHWVQDSSESIGENGVGNLRRLRDHAPRLLIASYGWKMEESEAHAFSTGLPNDDTQSSAGNPVLGDPAIARRSYLARVDFNDPFIPWQHPQVDAHAAEIDAQILALKEDQLGLNPTVDADQIQDIHDEIDTLLNQRSFITTDLGPYDRPTDMRRLSEAVFRTLAGIVQEQIGTSGSITFGGEDGEGDLELHFIPQALYRVDAPTNEPPGRTRKPGFGYWFTMSVRALEIIDLKFHIPIMVHIDMDQQGDIDVFIEPLRSLADEETAADLVFLSDVVFRDLVVTAENPLNLAEVKVAEIARNELLSGIWKFANLPTPDEVEAYEEFKAQEVVLRLGLIQAINRYRETNPHRDSNARVGEEFNVIALPAGGASATNTEPYATPLAHQFSGRSSTLILPVSDDSTPIRLYLLE